MVKRTHDLLDFLTLWHNLAKFSVLVCWEIANIFVTWPGCYKIMQLGEHDFPQVKSPPLQIWGPGMLSAGLRFFICHVTTWSKGHVTWWVGFPIASHHHSKFVGSRSLVNRDVILPILSPIPMSKNKLRFSSDEVSHQKSLVNLKWLWSYISNIRELLHDNNTFSTPLLSFNT